MSTELKKVFICSKYRGSTLERDHNVWRARMYALVAVTEGYLPIAPHLYFPQFLDDSKEDERALGIELGKKLMEECDEVWVECLQNPSEGMQEEIKLALALGKVIKWAELELDEDSFWTVKLMDCSIA